MKKLFFFIIGTLILIQCIVAQDFLKNPDFENQLSGWKLEAPMDGVLTIPEAAHEGRFGLRLTDSSEDSSTAARSESFIITPRKFYQLAFWNRVVSGGGVSAYMRFFDANGKFISQEQIDILSRNTSIPWKQYFLEGIIPENTHHAEVLFYTYKKAIVVADFDQITLKISDPIIEPPWAPSYKINPNEKEKLTESDIVGPDGIVYPNWTMAGLPSDLPKLKIIVKPEFFDKLENKDIYSRLTEAVNEVRKAGGGIIQLPAGHFFMSQMLVIRDNNIVIKGQGKDLTHIVFCDQISYGNIRFYNWGAPDTRVGPRSFLEFQANPKNLVLMEITSNGKLLGREKRGVSSWGNLFYVRINGSKIQHELGNGEHTLDVNIAYSNGDKFSKSFTIQMSDMPAPWGGVGDQHGAFMIVGARRIGDPFPIIEDAKRGARKVHVASDHKLKVGEYIQLGALETPRWRKIVGDATSATGFRMEQFEIVEVNGDWITVNQPLRMEYPKIDEPFVQRIGYAQGCGFENFTIEQKIITEIKNEKRLPETLWYPIEDLWTDGISFSYARGCWIRGVRIIHAGRNPIYLVGSKFCEVRDAECLDSLFKGGGGTGYVGLERTFDCLMESLLTKNLRHAPDLQYGSAGNVIRESNFYGSDGQWHAGWTKENLYECNHIYQEAKDVGDNANGGYGWGLSASGGPSSPLHGPQGPRNVVYGNDVVSPSDSIHMGGGNEGWIIVYNKFKADSGYGIFAQEKSFDHIIRGNVFIIKTPQNPFMYFAFPNCTGIEIYDNKIYGLVEKIAGFKENVGKFSKELNNQVLPYQADAPSPLLPTPSIYLWQKNLKNCGPREN